MQIWVAYFPGLFNSMNGLTIYSSLFAVFFSSERRFSLSPPVRVQMIMVPKKRKIIGTSKNTGLRIGKISSPEYNENKNQRNSHQNDAVRSALLRQKTNSIQNRAENSIYRCINLISVPWLSEHFFAAYPNRDFSNPERFIWQKFFRWLRWRNILPPTPSFILPLPFRGGGGRGGYDSPYTVSFLTAVSRFRNFFSPFPLPHGEHGSRSRNFVCRS